MSLKIRKCVTCGAPAVGVANCGRDGSPYCREHLPPHRRRFNLACFGALLRGEAARKERLAAAA